MDTIKLQVGAEVTMGGKLLAWRWGGGGEKHKPKDRTKSVNKSGKFRKVMITRYLVVSRANVVRM